MIAPPEGIILNFHKAFTQLHLGQPLASFKCTSGDRRDGGIDPKAENIERDSRSSLPCVDEDIG
jgi:hypothetical protein